jgi:hypothetical protein
MPCRPLSIVCVEAHEAHVLERDVGRRQIAETEAALRVGLRAPVDVLAAMTRADADVRHDRARFVAHDAADEVRLA